MAVLIEGLSVVVRNSALDHKFPGGSSRFQDGLRDDAICFDENLTCIHLTSPDEVGAFVGWCESTGLVFLANGACVDIVVVDQRNGPTTECEWIQYTRVPFNDAQSKGHIAICWLASGRPQQGAGIVVPSLKFGVSMPVGWSFEGSFSANVLFIPEPKSVKVKLRAKKGSKE